MFQLANLVWVYLAAFCLSNGDEVHLLQTWLGSKGPTTCLFIYRNTLETLEQHYKCLNNIRNFEHIVWIPQLVDIACGSLRRVLYGAGTRCIRHIVCPAFAAIWYTFLDLKRHCNWVWSERTPNWNLDGFKLRASTVSVRWTMGEREALADIDSFSPPTTI